MYLQSEAINFAVALIVFVLAWLATLTWEVRK